MKTGFRIDRCGTLFAWSDELLAHLTQRQLAEALGTSQRYLSELEAGKPKRIDQGYFDVLRKLGIVLAAETLDRGWSDDD